MPIVPGKSIIGEVRSPGTVPGVSNPPATTGRNAHVSGSGPSDILTASSTEGGLSWALDVNGWLDEHRVHLSYLVTSSGLAQVGFQTTSPLLQVSGTPAAVQVETTAGRYSLLVQQRALDVTDPAALSLTIPVAPGKHVTNFP